jgi:hypothetical protein
MNAPQNSEDNFSRFNLLKEFSIIVVTIVGFVVAALIGVATFAYKVGKDNASTEAKLREAQAPNEVRELKLKLEGALQGSANSEYAIAQLKESLVSWKTAHEEQRKQIATLSAKIAEVDNNAFIQEQIESAKSKIDNLRHQRAWAGSPQAKDDIDAEITLIETRIARLLEALNNNPN